MLLLRNSQQREQIGRVWNRKRPLALILKFGKYIDADDATEGGALKMMVKFGCEAGIAKHIASYL